ncbi:MAG: hypothetical protein IJJ98_06100 [Prevotella sp.]|nr:hypothetical protein [Prevotella sp.]
MKKIYIAPQIETTFYEPILMETATKLSGTVYDENGNNVGGITFNDDDSDPSENPDAKVGNLWDGWDD